jgi:HD-GYP domain-containing protein (c-di-GMP phosphodiesterase class II)
MVKIYSIQDDRERYIPISLDSLVPGTQIPFEIFTYDDTIFKSLLDKGSTYSFFAKEMIEKQAVSSFYIRQGNTLSFDEYMHNAARLKEMILDPDFFEEKYREFRDRWFIIDKQILNCGMPFTIPLGGLRFPLFGEIPFGVDGAASYRHLLDLNSDIAVRKKDIGPYYVYLDTILDAPDIEDPVMKLRVRREKLKVWCYRALEEIRNNAVSQDTLLKLYKHISLNKAMIANNFSIAGKLLFLDVSDTFLYVHSTNVCILSMMHGHMLNLPETDLLNLGISALFHDAGLTTIDDDASVDSQDEMKRDIFKSHVLRGKELLERYDEIPRVAITVALTHHEREDGSGYLYGLTGDRIHRYSKIVGLADTFESLRVSGYKQKTIKRTQVLGQMVRDGQTFDPEMFRIFLQFVAALSL